MARKKILPIIKDDPWLKPFAAAIEGRHNDAVRKIDELTGGTGKLVDFANAHHYYGLHHIDGGGSRGIPFEVQEETHEQEV